MRRNQKGFTLMELMVVIVIVAILAAVAVPLYVNYVRDAQRTEAKGAIGAVITAQQAHFQRYNDYITYSNDQFKDVHNDGGAIPEDRLECDIREAQQNWDFNVTVDDPLDGFTVTADGKSGRATEGLQVIYTHSKANPPESPWEEH